MKFIFSFFLGILLSSPVFADDADQCAGHNYSLSQCNNISGCSYTEDDGCQQCSPTEYSPTGEQSCLPCNTYSFSTGKIYDSANGIAGQSECPWMCDNEYYRGGANDDTCI